VENNGGTRTFNKFKYNSNMADALVTKGTTIKIVIYAFTISNIDDYDEVSEFKV